jgi:hypothetical protein
MVRYFCAHWCYGPRLQMDAISMIKQLIAENAGMISICFFAFGMAVGLYIRIGSFEKHPPIDQVDAVCRKKFKGFEKAPTRIKDFMRETALSWYYAWVEE